MRHIFVVYSSNYDHTPLIAFSDYNEAKEFAKKNERLLNAWEDDLHEVQLAEGGLIDELLRGLERKLDREGIKITGIDFGGDSNAD